LTHDGEPLTSSQRLSKDDFRERISSGDLAGTAGDHLARYAFAAHWVAGQRVADICAGIGYGANILASAGAVKVYGVDIDANAIDEARRRYGSRNLEFICADAQSGISLPEVDVAVCFEGIEHVKTPGKLLEGMVRGLSEQGVALISTPNGAAAAGGHSGNPYHLREFRRGEFEDLLRAYFGTIKMFFQWGFDGPYDWEWELRNLLRLLVPLRVKRFVRENFLPPASNITTTTSSNWQQPRSCVRYRPFPATYLSAPGLRVEPSTWLAVCAAPRKVIVR